MSNESIIKILEEKIKYCKKMENMDGNISDSEWERFRGEERAYRTVISLMSENEK